jgi:hypothetical protein
MKQTKTAQTFRISPSGLQKLTWLATLYGTRTTAIEVAIGNLFDKERERESSIYPPAVGLADCERLQDS